MFICLAWLALTPKQAVKHDDRHATDGQGRENEKADKEEFQGEQRVHGSTLLRGQPLQRLSPHNSQQRGDSARDCKDDHRSAETRHYSIDEPIFTVQCELYNEGPDGGSGQRDLQPAKMLTDRHEAKHHGCAKRGRQPHWRNAVQRVLVDGHESIVHHFEARLWPGVSARWVDRLALSRFGGPVAQLLILTPAGEDEVLPALELLSHAVRQLPATPSQLVTLPSCDVLLIDARHNLSNAKSLCKLLTSSGLSVPLLLIVSEGGLAAVSPDWGIDDVVLANAGPGEVDARVRLAIGKGSSEKSNQLIRASGLVIDEASYSAKANGRSLDLTFKEFELLRFLASHQSRVFTREQLLSEVWGYDYFGGTRTVDVHVRRLRAKLGDLESLIGTVRNVGYRFTSYEDEDSAVTDG